VPRHLHKRHAAWHTPLITCAVHWGIQSSTIVRPAAHTQSHTTSPRPHTHDTTHIHIVARTFGDSGAGPVSCSCWDLGFRLGLSPLAAAPASPPLPWPFLFPFASPLSSPLSPRLPLLAERGLPPPALGLRRSLTRALPGDLDARWGSGAAGPWSKQRQHSSTATQSRPKLPSPHDGA
jgi:hypothetical protein